MENCGQEAFKCSARGQLGRNRANPGTRWESRPPDWCANFFPPCGMSKTLQLWKSRQAKVHLLSFFPQDTVYQW